MIKFARTLLSPLTILTVATVWIWVWPMLFTRWSDRKGQKERIK